MRVIAIRDANDKEINIYGYGVYVGNEPCQLLGGLPNPKIILDSGDVVWGCECWWGDVERTESKFRFNDGGRIINTVSVERRGEG